jgi:hypothetical protein
MYMNVVCCQVSSLTNVIAHNTVWRRAPQCSGLGPSCIIQHYFLPIPSIQGQSILAWNISQSITCRTVVFIHQKIFLGYFLRLVCFGKLKQFDKTEMVFLLIGANAPIMKIHFKCILKSSNNLNKKFSVCI